MAGPPTSRDGSGLCMLGRVWARRAATLSMLAWLFPDAPPQPWMTVRSMSSAPARFFTFRPGPRDTIAGSWGVSPTSRCTFSARNTTQLSRCSCRGSILWQVQEFRFRVSSGSRLWVAPCQRRTATTVQMASTTPNGQAPCKKPYADPRAHDPANANTNQWLRSSSA